MKNSDRVQKKKKKKKDKKVRRREKTTPCSILPENYVETTILPHWKHCIVFLKFTAD